VEKPLYDQILTGPLLPERLLTANIVQVIVGRLIDWGGWGSGKLYCKGI